MARLIVLVLIATVGAIISASRPAAVAAVSCMSVNDNLVPCLPYVTDEVSEPSSGCCEGVQRVLDYAPSKPDLVAVCNCIKADLPEMGKVDTPRIAGLPTACGISRNFPPIDSNYDCSMASEF
ncbi:non-specific lipid-transfer protein A-like [Coffea arabica]|uniref:Non-specific lipid-transfer protein n=1 Tax=Coffea arabica TaxID=13443 RepID=A0ABM4WZZ4_COFAR|nr:non-specific lipid-transfer protein A-like [Coffea arabica]